VARYSAYDCSESLDFPAKQEKNEITFTFYVSACNFEKILEQESELIRISTVSKKHFF